MDDDKAKKLAAELRASSDSSEFDLAGYGAEQCDKLAAAAFTKPLPLDKMVRFSFLVGGGKKVRQKYNDGLPALWADALKKVGFVEDRGASLALECAGLFKFQHNTDTDLKVTHVYPRVDPAAAAAAAAAAAGEPSEAALSPAELIVLSEMGTFQRMIQAKCLSLGQKRRAHDLLKEARAGLAKSEIKMTNLEPLTDDEQQKYDTLDAAAIEEKQTWLGKHMEAMIDGGQLTAHEKTAVLGQFASKLEQLEVQATSAAAEGKDKRAEKMRAMAADLQTKCVSVRDAKPITRKLKFEAEIKAVQKRLAELEKLENSKQVLPLSEATKLNAKPKLLEDLAAMQADSRGWFWEAAT